MEHAISRRTAMALAAAGAIAPPVWAQSGYPSRPLQLIHGFSAGGNADFVARLLAQKLQELLKQPVVVEAKSGAGGSIATNFVAKAPADGYTLVLLTGAHTVSAALRKTLPYDSVKDFAFISTVSSFPFVIAVRAEHPAKSLAQLLSMARKENRVSYTSVGVGSTQHMVGELLGSSGGVRLLHIPYRGGGATVPAVLAGEADILADTLTVANPHIQSGRLRALAVTSAQQWPSAPGIPTAASMLPGFEVQSWLGLAAPNGTPDATVKRLNADVRKILQQADVQKILADAGSAATPSSPAAMQEMIQNDIARWRGVIARRGIQVE